MDGEVIPLTIKDVEYAPGLHRNLLSYGILEKKGIRLVYEGSAKYLKNRLDKLTEVHSEHGLLNVL